MLNRMRCLAVLAVGMFFLPRVALAAVKAEPEPEMFGGGQWFLSLLSLIVVVFLAYWVTRFIGGRYGNMPSRHIKVVESLCLGSNRHLYLLLVNNQVLLVGSTEQGLVLMKEYNDPQFYEELKESALANQTMAVGKLTNWVTPLLKKQGIANGSTVAKTESQVVWPERWAALQSWKTKRFKDLLAAFIKEQEFQTPLEEAPRVEVRERLAESLERIRAWKTKGRG